MEYIFHETQEGALCAQHCLNSLLQGDYYSAVDLANIAHDLDRLEQNFMSNESRSNHESSNYDDTGYFSIQVLQNALESWNLELIPYTSQNPVACMARELPTEQKAYICNFRNHWYTIRKIGNYWFNLNSLLSSPELISDTHLSILLAQLINDSYSIFIVNGELPKSEADFCLAGNVLDVKTILSTQSKRKTNNNEDTNDPELDDELKRAIRMSLMENDLDLDRHSGGGPYPSLAYDSGHFSKSNQNKSSHNDDDEEFKRAIELSMQQDEIQAPTNKPSTSKDTKPMDLDEVRRKRLEYLEKMSQKPASE